MKPYNKKIVLENGKEFYGYGFSVGAINLLFEPPYRLVVVYAVYG